MESTRSLARRAGWLYFLQSVVAPFAYVYVPNTLLGGDPVERVRAHAGLLRAAIAVELFSATVAVFALLALYRLFEGVDRRLATLMTVLFLVSVPVSYVNVLFHLGALIAVGSPAITGALDPGQLGALVTLLLRLHNYGLVVAQIPWGLWLLPLGLLVLRCGFLPRGLAYPLFPAGVAYVLNSLGTLFLPPPLRAITAGLQLLGIGELPVVLYLMFRGARER